MLKSEGRNVQDVIQIDLLTFNRFNITEKQVYASVCMLA